MVASAPSPDECEKAAASGKGAKSNNARQMLLEDMIKKQTRTAQLQDPSATETLMRTWSYADDTTGHSDWSLVRSRMHSFFKSPVYDWMLAVVLVLNMVVVIVEVDADAQDNKPSQSVQTLSSAFTIVYVIEMVARIYVFRSKIFTHAASLVELGIVFGDCLVSIMGHASALAIVRIFRLTRLGRALRLITLFPELHLMMKGLMGAMSAVIWGSLFLALCLIIWSIIFVIAVHPFNKNIDYGDCSRCPDAFASVGSAFLTFCQTVVVGDGWGTVAVPLVEAYFWTAPLLAGVFMSVALTVMNLILAVICDGAERARQLGDRELAEKKLTDLQSMKAGLHKLCKKMDEDGSGDLALEEIIHEFDKEEQFYDILLLLDIQKSDLDSLFTVMDRDKNGRVDYEEFVEQMTLVKGQDVNTILYFIKHYVTESYLALVDLQKDAQAHIPNTTVKVTSTETEKFSQDCKFDAAKAVPVGGRPTSLNDQLLVGHFEEVAENMKSLVRHAQEHSTKLEKIVRFGGSSPGNECLSDGQKLSMRPDDSFSKAPGEAHALPLEWQKQSL